MTVSIFTEIFNALDKNLIGVIQSGSSKMIYLITPLVLSGFSIYVLLILASYWRGDHVEPVMDFLMRMVGWAAIITFGMNIGYYTQYIVPFINGSADQLSAAILGSNVSSAASLDNMANAFYAIGEQILTEATGFEDRLMAVIQTLVLFVCSFPFLIVTAFIILSAKLGLGILLALGPLFIATAFFPATRQLFSAWTAQCLNYVLIVVILSFIAAFEINFMTSQVANKEVVGTFKGLIIFSISGLIFFYLTKDTATKLASALAGGVGISTFSNSGFGKAAKAIGKLIDSVSNGRGNGARSAGGGSIKGSNKAEQKPEQKSE